MLAVLNRYKLLLIIMLLIILAALIWLYFVVQGVNKTPTKGVFVMGQDVCAYYQEGSSVNCSR